MKKSLLLLLSIPLLLAGCDFTTTSGDSNKKDETQQDDESGSHSSHSGNHNDSHGNNDNNDDDDDNHNQDDDNNTSGGGGQNEQTSKTISINVGDLKLSNGEKPTTLNLASDLSLNLGAGTNKNKNAPAYYTSDGSLRAYLGNTLEFSSTSKITKIEITANFESGTFFDVDVGTLSNETSWTGSSNKVVFEVAGKGKVSISGISLTYGGVGGGTSGGGSSTDDEGGSSGKDIQAGNGNTSHSFTSPWTGDEYDIAYSMFKGNLPHLSDFNKYALGNVAGTTVPYFNPYEESNWSKTTQDDYDKALKEMGYTFIESLPFEDDEGNVYKDTPVYYYQKGTFHVQTSHYSGKNNVWYFDVYAYNSYQAPFEIDYTPTVDLNKTNYKIGKGNKSYSQTINNITFKMNSGCENKECIQISEGSSLEITSTTALSKMDITFFENSYACLVYAGSSASNAKIVYNDGSHYELPSGTKYVKLRALSKYFNFDDLTIK